MLTLQFQRLCWSKGEDHEYLGKATYHWGLCREKAQYSWEI